MPFETTVRKGENCDDPSLFTCISYSVHSFNVKPWKLCYDVFVIRKCCLYGQILRFVILERVCPVFVMFLIDGDGPVKGYTVIATQGSNPSVNFLPNNKISGFSK